jgi:hypothetical protein
MSETKGVFFVSILGLYRAFGVELTIRCWISNNTKWTVCFSQLPYFVYNAINHAAVADPCTSDSLGLPEMIA